MIDTIKKYALMGLSIVLVLLAGYLVYVENELDNAQIKLDLASNHISLLQQANINLKGSIELLEQQSKQNRIYIAELEAKRTETEKQAIKLVQEFKVKKHENQTINNWASQPLPDGLY